MQVTLEIPDDVAKSLVSMGHDPGRVTLESLAIEGYRSGSLSPLQARRLLGFETRFEFEGFLKAHQISEQAYDLKDLVEDRETLRLLQAEGRLKAV